MVVSKAAPGWETWSLGRKLVCKKEPQHHQRDFGLETCFNVDKSVWRIAACSRDETLDVTESRKDVDDRSDGAIDPINSKLQ